MSLREIRTHSRNEILVMLKSLERRNILEEGSGITENMREGNPLATSLYARYLDELDKYKKQGGGGADSK